MTAISTLSSKAAYRVRQTLHALRPKLESGDSALVRERLSGTEADLFFSTEKRDQRHAIEVLRRLVADGHNDPDLLVAALLHDCGKGSVPVWLRIAWVAAPWLVTRAASAPSGGWRGAAYHLANHARLGAEKAAAAGARPAVVRLISGDVEADERDRIALLRSADDLS